MPTPQAPEAGPARRDKATGHVAPETAHILVVGMVRDAARTMPTDLARLRDALGFARTLSWLIVESDSRDITLEVLDRCRQDDPALRVLSLGALTPRLPARTERIAHCRNAARDLVETDYPDVDYVVLADMDDLNNRLTRAGVLSCWERDDWGACMANQSGFYYDIWALRHDVWCPNDCWAQNDFFEAHGSGFVRARLAAVYLKMLRIPRDAEWIEVRSAFGGFAVYTRAALLSGRYTGPYPDGRQICEHVPFHAMLREAGHRLFINPRMINAHYSGHMPWKAAWRKLRHKTLASLRRLRSEACPPGLQERL